MAFDSDTRNKLARMVAQARQLLTDEFTQQLQEIYGIQPDGAIVDVEKLTHLDDEEVVTAKFLRERIGHLVSGMATEKKSIVAAIDRAVREQAFTILNRFAALRMCEERSLVEECVRAGMHSKGFKVYETIAGSGLGDIYERYKTFLFCLFDEIAVDLGVLFDRFSPQGLLFPRAQALLGLLAIINNDGLSKLWTEDETIGWIYQYFNPPEERRAMREASQAPRNSRELAVRNQFFTPRYVVEFLTDNTLGRIWYEMRMGDTALKEECRYLVRRPNEAFLAPGEKAPAELDDETDLSQEELLKQPVYIEHRSKKDPREIKVLDPACGSGHFLLYAFDLLEFIYEESWEDPQSPKFEITGQTLRQDFETLEELRRAVPKMIIEHNLHGIDIDPRTVQIAALSLWLRAQKTWTNLSIKIAERPRVAKSNIVTAEPLPDEEDMRRDFTAGLKPRVLGQLVDVVFDKLKLAGEAGSLLKMEEEIKDAIVEAKKQWLEGPKMEQIVLFPEMVKPKSEQQQLRFDLTGVTDERFWEQAEDRILDALKDYAERAENGHAIRRKLFAEDAARGLAFIDLCRVSYDVVLMNPPFGEAVPSIRHVLERAFLGWSKNLASAFIIMALGRMFSDGLVGVVADRTIIVKSSYEAFRRRFYSELYVVADLGWNVLDANVEVTIMVLGNTSGLATFFFDVRQTIAKARVLSDQVLRLGSEGLCIDECFVLATELFATLPNCVFAYDMPRVVVTAFRKMPNLLQSGHRALQGHNLSMEQFGRLSWEVSAAAIADLSFVRMYKGGDYCKFYQPSYEVALWLQDGSHLRGHPGTRWGNELVQGNPGIGYGKRGNFLDAHILHAKHIFTVEGLAIFPRLMEDAWSLLCILNSIACSYLLHFYSGQHKMSGYLEKLPIPESNVLESEVASEAKALFYEKRLFDQNNELSPIFAYWSFLSHETKTFISAAGLLMQLQEAIRSRGQHVDSQVNKAYGFRDSDLLEDSFIKTRPQDVISIAFDASDHSSAQQTLVETWTQYIIGCIFGRWDVRVAIDSSLAPKLSGPFDSLPVCPPGMLVGPDGLPADTGRIVSEEWLRARPDANTLPPESAFKNPTIPDSNYPIRIDWDGILVDNPEHDDDIVRRIHDVMEVIWRDRCEVIEREACEILGVQQLRYYFGKPSGFFQDHMKRYSKSRRKAPIYWPLSTKSGSYTLWIYYHRLTDQTLYACVNDYVSPKLDNVSKDIVRLQEEVTKQGSTKNRQSLEQLMDFEQELKDYRDELLRVTGLPYKPNLNDGIMITAAPLWKLFRHNQWRKDLEGCWKKLKEGEYDWAHLAYAIWPDRVKKKCRKDLSIAIAHDLEDLYEGDDTKPKRRKGIVESIE